MGRPKIRNTGTPRFKVGERVIWKSGKNWRSGEVLHYGKGKQELLKAVPEGYKLQYSEKDKMEDREEGHGSSESKSFTYLVAADSPLFRPGYTVHSIPERHLQKETESWVWKENLITTKEIPKKNLKELVIEVVKTMHKSKKSVPTNIQEKIFEIMPELQEGPSDSTSPTELRNNKENQS